MTNNSQKMAVEIIEADLKRREHQRDIVELINVYAMDPMGNGKPLSENVKTTLIPGLQQHPTTHIFIAYKGDNAVGIAVCFRGFSTFLAQPLMNIHDLAVLPSFRGQKIGQQLLAAVEKKAKELGCCKLTLEVLENNYKARRLYEMFGFARAQYQKEAGGALFLAKSL